MKVPTATQQETQKENALRLKQSVCELLGWTEMEFSQFQYEQGLKYIDSLCVAPETNDAMERSQLFWNWWKNQWAIFDNDFVNAAQWLKHDAPLMYMIYLEMHDGRILSGKVLPHRVVMVSITKAA